MLTYTFFINYEVKTYILDNKFYVNAIVTCIFIFINVILYLISVIFVCKGSAGDFFEDDEDELNDVEVNNFDLNQSLRSNSWNRSRKSKTRREEVIFINKF